VKLLQQINAEAPASTRAEELSSHLAKGLKLEEMRRARGRHYTQTNFYQIRVKPVEKDALLEDVLISLERYLNSNESAKIGISGVQINERSKNSGKYSSVSFKAGGKNYDAVVAKGGNVGETFEKNLLLKMDALVSKGTSSLDLGDAEHAKLAFTALEKIDPVFALKNIASVAPRSGSTRGAGRRGDLTPEEAGAIIGDIVVKLKNGDKKYISIKSARGATVAQFGLVRAFNDDLTVNPSSPEWKYWLQPFGLDIKKIEKGLRAARDQKDLPWKDVDTSTHEVKEGSGIFKILQKMWGTNYYLLKELPNGGFSAQKIDADYVDKKLLKNLKVTEIRYPSKDRKQINVYLDSDSTRFKVEVRNPRGMGAIKPTQIQLTVLKGPISSRPR